MDLKIILFSYAEKYSSDIIAIAIASYARIWNFLDENKNKNCYNFKMTGSEFDNQICWNIGYYFLLFVNVKYYKRSMQQVNIIW